MTGSLVQAYGQYQQGKAAEQQFKYQAKVSRQQAETEASWHAYNAEMSRREAEAEMDATRAEATQQARRAKMEASRARAIRGASGVNIEGSPLLLLEDNAEQRKLEEVDILTRGRRRFEMLESQSILDMSKSRAALKAGRTTSAGLRMKGAAAKRAGKIAAVGTSLQGASSAYSTSSQLTGY